MSPAVSPSASCALATSSLATLACTVRIIRLAKASVSSKVNVAASSKVNVVLLPAASSSKAVDSVIAPCDARFRS
eukprot:scaffold183584_cov28-Tisochrysis_lutea.AAC.8